MDPNKTERAYFMSADDEKDKAFQQLMALLGSCEDFESAFGSLTHKQQMVLMFGIGWRSADWKTRRSLLHGEMCSVYIKLYQLEAKTNRLSPGSIGHRKARAESRQLKRKLNELIAKAEESFSDYQTDWPQYITRRVIHMGKREPTVHFIRKDGPQDRAIDHARID